MRTYYDILGIVESADKEEIKKAYKRLALKLHPDRNPSTDAHAAFQTLQEAYEVLSDPDKRSMYDYLRTAAKERENEKQRAYEEYVNAQKYYRKAPTYSEPYVYKKKDIALFVGGVLGFLGLCASVYFLMTNWQFNKHFQEAKELYQRNNYQESAYEIKEALFQKWNEEALILSIQANVALGDYGQVLYYTTLALSREEELKHPSFFWKNKGDAEVALEKYSLSEISYKKAYPLARIGNERDTIFIAVLESYLYKQKDFAATTDFISHFGESHQHLAEYHLALISMSLAKGNCQEMRKSLNTLKSMDSKHPIYLLFEGYYEQACQKNIEKACELWKPLAPFLEEAQQALSRAGCL